MRHTGPGTGGHHRCSRGAQLTGCAGLSCCGCTPVCQPQSVACGRQVWCCRLVGGGGQHVAALRGSPVDHGRHLIVEQPAVTLAHGPLQRLRQRRGRLSHAAPRGTLLAAALLDPGTPHLQAGGGGATAWQQRLVFLAPADGADMTRSCRLVDRDTPHLQAGPGRQGQLGASSAGGHLPDPQAGPQAVWRQCRWVPVQLEGPSCMRMQPVTCPEGCPPCLRPLSHQAEAGTAVAPTCSLLHCHREWTRETIGHCFAAAHKGPPTDTSAQTQQRQGLEQK